MKLVIFGASGKTGKHLITQALEQGHGVTAYVRRSSAIEFQHPNLKLVIGTLAETMTMREAILGADCCISALGGASLTKHSPHIINGIDRIINLMENEGVKRFIYLSSLGAGESRFFMPRVIRFLLGDILLRVPLADHNINEQRIKASHLNWTIVRPGGLTDGPKTSISRHGSESIKLKGGASISRANVASFMLEQISNNEYYKKSIWLFEKQ